jgi:hypothetical protein
MIYQLTNDDLIDQEAFENAAQNGARDLGQLRRVSDSGSDYEQMYVPPNLYLNHSFFNNRLLEKVQRHQAQTMKNGFS